MRTRKPSPTKPPKATGYQIRWQRYEMLKSAYTAAAATSGDYAQACKRAAQEAGV